jgi:putative Mg2+ transporter-C (MgtC) family protein
MIWRFLIGNLRLQLAAPWLEVVLALVAVVCGAIVGAEREKREKPAGLRTVILVCLGSAAFTMASFAFTTSTGDSGRVAAQIVTGIGFLGAGAILHGSGFVRGMTTAATIWAMAATGMIVGIGFAGAGLGLSLLVRFVLTAARAIELRGLGRLRDCPVEIAFEANGGKTQIQVERLLEDFHVEGALKANEPAGDGTVRATFRSRLHRRHYLELLSELAALPDMKEIKPLGR